MDCFYVRLWADFTFGNGWSYTWPGEHASVREMDGDFHPSDCYNFANLAWD